MNADQDAAPRFYSELAELWPLVSPPEDYEEEAGTFRTLLARHGVVDGASLLHLGCGGGSLDHQMAKYYRVTGVDLSEDMLRVARRTNPGVRYEAGDMRTWRGDVVFDAVLVHDAISYMTTPAELEAVYRTAAAHLAPGGVLVALPEELRERADAFRGSVETHMAGSTRVDMVELAHDEDPSDNEFELVYIFAVRDGAGFRVEVDRHSHGVFELSEFVAAVEAAGFTASVHPWELSSWGPDEIPLPLIVGVKQPAP